MKRPAGYKLAIASVLCILVFALCLALWIRSFWSGYYISYIDGGGESVASVKMLRSAVILVWHNRSGQSKGLAPQWTYRPDAPDPPVWTWAGERDFAFLGLGYWWRRDYGSCVMIPFWLPCMLSLVPPALWYRRRREPLEGHCRKCGYDLRATPDRCPECGTPVAAGR